MCVPPSELSCTEAMRSKLSPVSGNTGRMPLVHLYLNVTRTFWQLYIPQSAKSRHRVRNVLVSLFVDNGGENELFRIYIH